ncbi:hypothetical protein [Sphingomonas bacterium]|uniref:hypothetical protein n=1 Tax=Sphingomonas bacterium TaxID=1895847 RepID=UPI0026379BA8|nr:hypothetical protein [Sphingomonas bacterium]
MTPIDRYAQLKALSVSVPDLGAGRLAKAPSDPDALRWLGMLTAIVRKQKESADHILLDMAANRLGTMSHDASVSEIMLIFYRALALAELEAPEAARGSFIAVGNTHDAYVAVSSLLQSATESVLIVDPYLDGSIINKFVLSAGENVSVMLLSDSKSVYPNLLPALNAFVQQYGNKRPIEARVSPPRSLHDRLIILDSKEAWDLSQSLKDLATRSPAAIARTDNDLSGLKIAHYQTEWQQGTMLA